MCILDESVMYSAAMMALGALLIMLINCLQTRMNKKHAAEIQRICAERVQFTGSEIVVEPWPEYQWSSDGRRNAAPPP